VLSIPKTKRVNDAYGRSKTQERDRAKRLGGSTTKASGAQPFEKGDVRVAGLARIELKTTSAKSFSVTRDTLKKIEDAAITSGEIPFLEIEFLEGGNPVSMVAVIPTWALDILVDKLNAIESN